jgi:2-succinyl-5-enolpyruvyl-6-hydroxy-3-cyclohexene-1-carboxylate synthase
VTAADSPPMERGGLHTVWARRLVGALAELGVREIVLSPGSRSTPLALAAAAEARLRVTVVVDERAAAFVALGQARVTGKPSVVVCTSGTAAAHHHPAVAEADAAGVPLIVLTADRPLELQDASASQTIDQVKLFGDHVRRFADLGVPDAAALLHLPRMVATAVLASLSPRPGPVHVNARFRKPLEPTEEAVPFGDASPAPRLYLPRAEPPDEAVRDLAESVRSARSVLLVAGPLRPRAGEPASIRRAAMRRAAAAFARAAGAAIAAEPTSGVLGSSFAAEPATGSVDLLLRTVSAPDLVVEIGRPPVAGVYSSFVVSVPSRVIIGEGGLSDPSGGASALIAADPILTLTRATERLERLGGGPLASSRAEYAERSREHGRRIDRAIARELESGELTEALLARELAGRIPDGAFLLVGNSSPVRDLCAYASTALRDVTVMHQRGAAGIDGLFAGAAGARLVAPPEVPVALLLGDVSALHDVGSLALLARATGPLVCVVADNAGGRIFEELPVARTAAGAAHLSELFLTPPVPGFLGAVAAGFGVAHARVSSRIELGAALDRAFAANAPWIVEVAVDPQKTRDTRERIRTSVTQGDADG